MSTEYVNQVTLECLMNKDTYKKYVATKKKGVVNKKDQKFYRRRILSLTKELLYPEETTTPATATTTATTTTTTTNDPNVVGLFQIYSKACIEYFKTLDKNDIIQEDYSTLTTETNEMSVEDIKTQAEIDQQFMRSIHVKEAATLDKFVKRSTPAPKDDPILPKQKDINLRDPALKNKGIRKKKNITNKYEEESKTKNTEGEANK